MLKSLTAIGTISGAMISIVTNPLHIIEVFVYAAVGAAAGEFAKRIINKKWPQKKS